jgi:hypothetical protein
MADFTPHQRKIIDRYYDHRDEIMLNKLQEIVTEIYLATSEKKIEQLWGRAEKAMTQLKTPATVARDILSQRKPEVLAKHVTAWLNEAKK